MYDESGESGAVTCPHCGADSNEGCPHLLMLLDVTFCQCDGGVACNYKGRFELQVSAVFTRLLAEGARPAWANFDVRGVWQALLEEGVEDPDDIVLPEEPFLELLIAVLEKAGGWEHPGALVSESGGYCESSVRLLYAEDPEQVCKDAEKVLEAWLRPEEPKPKKSRKRK